jgi:hypothetical protein
MLDSNFSQLAFFFFFFYFWFVTQLRLSLNQNKMKKVMFTAIAMIAFVGSSMANTMVLEEEKKTEPVDCVAVATAVLDAADPNNTMTQKQAFDFYQGQYNAWLCSIHKYNKLII